MPSGFASSSCSHTSSPVNLSNARRKRSCELARKTNPPAVTTGLFCGLTVPVVVVTLPTTPGAVPSATRHLMVPSFRSNATSCDHGGPVTGYPLLVYHPAENEPPYRVGGP